MSRILTSIAYCVGSSSILVQVANCKTEDDSELPGLIVSFTADNHPGEICLLDEPLRVTRKRNKRVEHQCASREQEKEPLERWNIGLEERIRPMPG